MKTHSLVEFLAGLAKPVSQLAPRETGERIREIAEALRPFADMDSADLIAFLLKSKVSYDDGSVRPDSPALMPIQAAWAEFQTRLEHAADGHEVHSHRQAIADSLQTLATEAGIKIGKPSLVPKWFADQKSERNLAKVILQIRELAESVTSVEQIAEPEVRQRIASLATSAGFDLGLAVKQLGGNAGSAKKPVGAAEQIESSIVKLNGFTSSKAKKSAKVGPTDESLAEHISELKKLVETSHDLDAVPIEKINSATAKLEAAKFTPAQLGKIALEVAGVKTTGAKNAYREIRARLTRHHRAAESQTT